MSQSRRAIVIGAGVVGVASALCLLRKGWAVTILDPRGVAEGTSFGNISVIATEGVVPVATPGVLSQVPKMLLDPLGPLAVRWRYLPALTPWLLRFLAASRPREVERISTALAALMEDALPAWRRLLKEAGLEDMVRQKGWITVYRSERALERERDMIALRRRLGIAVEILDAAELRQLEPALSRDIVTGVYYPEVAHSIQNKDMVVRLAEYFEAKGGDIRLEKVSDIQLGPRGVEAVITSNGTRMPCDGLVLAAGAWSKRFAKKLGAPLPLDTERGYHLTIPDPGIETTRPIHDGDQQFVATMLTNGLRIGGTVEFAGLEAPPNWKRAEVLKSRGRSLFPDLKTEEASRWMGFRPSMPDSLPVISVAPGAANAVLAFGHGHIGLTLGARTGELVGALLQGEEPGLDLSPFRADRF